MHLRVLAHKYPFDTVQMPLSVFDAHAEGFQKLVLPELLKQGIAPLAMKTLGGNGRSVKDGLITAEEALRYALSLPIATLISGIDSLAWLKINAGAAANFKPYTSKEMAALEQRCAGKNSMSFIGIGLIWMGARNTAAWFKAKPWRGGVSRTMLLKAETSRAKSAKVAKG